jgi:hypothetical protein
MARKSAHALYYSYVLNLHVVFLLVGIWRIMTGRRRWSFKFRIFRRRSREKLGMVPRPPLRESILALGYIFTSKGSRVASPNGQKSCGLLV